MFLQNLFSFQLFLVLIIYSSIGLFCFALHSISNLYIILSGIYSTKTGCGTHKKTI